MMAIDIGSSTRVSEGQSACGNRCGWWLTTTRIVMAIADGQGYGEAAAHAAESAMACIGAGLERTFDEIFAACDARLRDSRGVAMGLAVVDLESGQMSMASVGNIRTVLLTARMDYRLAGTKGLVGSGYERFTQESKSLAAGDVLMLLSEGMDEFPGAQETRVDQSSGEQARIMVDRWGRADDDAAVLIYRHQA